MDLDTIRRRDVSWILATVHHGIEVARTSSRWMCAMCHPSALLIAHWFPSDRKSHKIIPV